MNRILAAAALGAWIPFACAQEIKPGLWESTSETQFSGNGQMQQQMANMPPEQRKMVEEMMKSRGVTMNLRNGGGMSVRFCLTPEMAARKEIPTQRGDCKATHRASGPGRMKVAFTCSNPPSSGEGEVTFSSPEAYRMKMVVSTGAQGRPEKMKIEASGRWLGADCGDVNPPGAR